MIYVYIRVAPGLSPLSKTNHMTSYLQEGGMTAGKQLIERADDSEPWRRREIAILIRGLMPGDLLAVDNLDDLDPVPKSLIEILYAIRDRGAYLMQTTPWDPLRSKPQVRDLILSLIPPTKEP
jgi:hypothetical protein